MNLNRPLLLAILFALTLPSCASYFKRKDCEKTNWYEYGNKVAMGGKRPDSDTFVNECKQVDANINYADLDLGFKAGMANYCKPKTVYATGKKGEKFNENLCDFGKLKGLKEQHARGVKVFCKASNGARFGAKGQVYNDICPADMEEAFLAQYRVGRKRYLRLEIQQNRRQISQLDRKISSKERELNNHQRRLSLLPVVNALSANSNPGGNPQLYEERKREAQRRRDNLNSKINQVRRQINDLRDEQDGLRRQIDDYENEMAAL